MNWGSYSATVDLVDVKLDHASSDTYGQVTGGELRMRGQVKHIKVIARGQHGFWYIEIQGISISVQIYLDINEDELEGHFDCIMVQSSNNDLGGLILCSTELAGTFSRQGVLEVGMLHRESAERLMIVYVFNSNDGKRSEICPHLTVRRKLSMCFIRLKTDAFYSSVGKYLVEILQVRTQHVMDDVFSKVESGDLHSRGRVQKLKLSGLSSDIRHVEQIDGMEEVAWPTRRLVLLYFHE